TSNHGFLKKLDNTATHFMNGAGNWATPLTAMSLPRTTQTTTYAPTTTDNGSEISFAGASADATWTIAAGATNGTGWFAIFNNPTTHNLTIKVTTNTIDGIAGATGFIMYPGEVRLVQCDGTNYFTTILNGGVATFTSSTTWQKPPGYSAFQINLMSSGGSGASRTTTGNAGGGAGGSGYEVTLPSSVFVAAGSTETVTVGGTSAGVSGNTAGNAKNASSLTVNGTAFSNVVTGAAAATAASSSAATGGASDIAVSISSNTQGNGESRFRGGTGGDVTSGNVPEGSLINSVFGGGGGGASSSTAGGVRTGGASLTAGAGGAGGANTGGNGTNGTAPGGGGGGAVQGGTSGSGAAGQVIIRGII
ncbi:MAG: hypothetical protein KGJ90_07195, partial [Patescibacteria group bacterium]|nr:hypothetical protein [Patescibacteria group bacterium]